MSLAALGDVTRAREWTDRAVLIDPDNISMRYNLACGLAYLREFDAVIELIGPYFAAVSITQLKHSAVDPDLDEVRSDPRFRAMTEAALTRLGAGWADLPGHEAP